jgi:adenylate kinase
MIDDATMSKVVKEMLTGIDSFLLDGYPRNLAQAQELQKVCGGITLALFLDVPRSVLVERITSM